jgi:hypothetical protein
MTPYDLKTRDQRVIERALPALMLFLMMEDCKRIGMEARADVLHHLNAASAAPFAELDMLSISRVAKRTDDMAKTLLRDLNADDPRHALYVAAMFTLLLVEEGRIADKGNQAVLVSLLLIEDVKDEDRDNQGALPVWKYNERKWRAEAGKLINRATIMGLYLKPLQLIA